MVILNAKELRLTVQIAHITTALSLFKDFNRVFKSYGENKEIVKKIKKLPYYVQGRSYK